MLICGPAGVSRPSMQDPRHLLPGSQVHQLWIGGAVVDDVVDTCEFRHLVNPEQPPALQNAKQQQRH